MDKNAIAQKLKALASDHTYRSKAARFRDVFNDVEETLAAGVSRVKVLETLSGLGLDYTLKGFDSALRRNRLKHDAATHRPAQSRSPQAQAESPDEEAAARTGNWDGSHRPADLDQIIASKPDLAALAKFAKRKTT